jgi:hypothetical protein
VPADRSEYSVRHLGTGPFTVGLMALIPPAKWVFTQHHQRILESKECLASLHSEHVCDGKIVRAHIIPRSQLLQIATRGHVHAVPTRLSAVMQMQHSAFEARDIGARDFSILNCFCARHDKALFAPLEDRPLTFSLEQLTLLHYRAIAAEAYQRGNQEEAAAAVCRTYKSDDPRRGPFYSIFQMASHAAEAAEETLKETESILKKAQYQRLGFLIIRFDAEPVLLSVGAFRPPFDINGKEIQDIVVDGIYVGVHVLIADNKPALVVTWLRGQKPAERFAKSLADQPRESLATLAVQTAFEYAEHTCMKREWWLSLNVTKRRSLLKRVRNANSLSYRRSGKCLAFRSAIDDWGFNNLEIVH